ncbi:DUF3825 domain-containing protein [Methylobacterium sp. EM32]|uniref:DUF3825 domain-containing protein n=1 Tax=Methylobacterium sp. EM32 TaxID=3163481 RepID=UPI0033B7C3BB
MPAADTLPAADREDPGAGMPAPAQAEEPDADPADASPEEASPNDDAPLPGEAIFGPVETGIVKPTYTEGSGWGFVRIEGKPDLYFKIKGGPCVVKPGPHPLAAGCTVTATVERSGDGRSFASSLHVDAPAPTLTPEEMQERQEQGTRVIQALMEQVPPGAWFTRWSNVKLNRTDKRNINDATVRTLAKTALDEDRTFTHSDDEHLILRQYLKYTFARLARENKIAYAGPYAAFDTGLLDKLYEPILCLSEYNEDARRYSHVSFCVAGQGPAGKRLISVFADRPAPARYLTRLDEVMFDPACPVTPQWSHIIKDAIERGRFPLAFLQHYAPAAFHERLNDRADEAWMRDYVRALASDIQARRAIAGHVAGAIETARKRVRWDYKTAVPIYYPAEDAMSFILPLALRPGGPPDLALVARRVNPNEYYGVTVYTLEMAYLAARLIGPLTGAGWLTPRIGEATNLLSYTGDLSL